MGGVKWKSITNEEIIKAYKEKVKAEKNLHETMIRVRLSCSHKNKLEQIWVGSMYDGDFCIDCGSAYGETRGHINYAEV